MISGLRAVAKRLTTASTDDLKQRTKQLRDHAEKNVSNAKNIVRGQPFLTEGFSLMFEAIRRTTGKSFYDVQLLAGRALSQDSVVEMQTGEGKTLTSTLPAFVFSLFGQGVHVATTNHYLAQRDYEELSPAFSMLGVSVGLLPSDHDFVIKRRAYHCDVTFGTGYEFGFDYLRDQIVLRRSDHQRLGQQLQQRLSASNRADPLLQRGHAFAIIDEVDSVLIDEATMPLVLSMSAKSAPSHRLLQLAVETIDRLVEGDDYSISQTDRSIEITPTGTDRIFGALENDQTLGLKRPWNVYVEQALRAAHILKRDVDYVVNEGAIEIVDQHTGRVHPERTWRDGLHQAIEFREGVEVTPEKEVEGRVSRQRYFHLYDHVCGMTGTTTGVESEFHSFYQLPVVRIPTHRSCQRQNHSTLILRTNDDRNAAILLQLERQRANGQPVLIGTRTIQHSNQLSQLLRQHGIEHSVLNGMQDELEAQLVAEAGQPGAVTVATNMAGRGTDIQLHEEVIEIGGLCVIGAEHNLTQRIDRQLTGRAARQGQPGCAMFFASLSDELFQHIDDRLRQRIVSSLDRNGGRTNRFNTDIASVQTKIEQEHYERRQAMVQRDRWMENVLESLAKTDNS